MDSFIHRQNLEHYRKQLAATTDEAQRRMILKLLADEEAKEPPLCARNKPAACRGRTPNRVCSLADPMVAIIYRQ